MATAPNRKRLNTDGIDIASPTIPHGQTGDNKKKKKKKTILPTIINNPNHPLEQVAAILAQRQNHYIGSVTSTRLHPSLLNVGWEVARCSNTGKDYYYNRRTGDRTWDPPQEQPEQQPQQQNQEQVQPHQQAEAVINSKQSNDWKVTKDSSTGKEYYYNIQTGETTWEKPTIMT
jgi:WW domain